MAFGDAAHFSGMQERRYRLYVYAVAVVTVSDHTALQVAALKCLVILMHTCMTKNRFCNALKGQTMQANRQSQQECYKSAQDLLNLQQIWTEAVVSKHPSMCSH